jgi:hypothetical protein
MTWIDKETLGKYETECGTTFVSADGSVEITRSDQPVCVVPFADIEEFFHERLDRIDRQSEIVRDGLRRSM